MSSVASANMSLVAFDNMYETAITTHDPFNGFTPDLNLGVVDSDDESDDESYKYPYGIHILNQKAIHRDAKKVRQRFTPRVENTRSPPNQKELHRKAKERSTVMFPHSGRNLAIDIPMGPPNQKEIYRDAKKARR